MKVSLAQVRHLLPATPRRRPATAPAVSALPDGTILCEGFVPGRPVPWKTHARPGKTQEATRRHQDYQRYKAWKQALHYASLVLRDAEAPYPGPVRIDCEFRFRPGGLVPDIDNLRKALSDALQGSVIANDRQAWAGSTRRVLVGPDGEEGAWMRVTAEGASEWSINHPEEG